MHTLVPIETIAGRIYLIRGTKVMLDRDLAELYGVDTGQLKRAVRRNIDRFPDDFMFALSKKELENWRCQFGISNSIKMGLRHSPMALTELGVAMLSSVMSRDGRMQREQDAQEQCDVKCPNVKPGTLAIFLFFIMKGED